MKFRIVPVMVFGAGQCDNWPACKECDEHEGYGLMDATSAWSDCNRAIGHIFRVDDMPVGVNPDRQSIEVEVNDEDLWFFERDWDAPN